MRAQDALGLDHDSDEIKTPPGARARATLPFWGAWGARARARAHARENKREGTAKSPSRQHFSLLARLLLAAKEAQRVHEAVARADDGGVVPHQRQELAEVAKFLDRVARHGLFL